MSKNDEIRALREARYERNRAAAGKPKDTAKQVTQPAPTAKKTATTPAKKAVTSPAKPTDDADDTLCGHRSMNGRTCTREAGHAAKSHRYS